jgi:hypothetical protein
MQVLFANTPLVVIVSKDSRIQTISKNDISNIFLSQTKELPNGQKAIPLELNNRSYKNFFYEQISSKTLKQLKKYWATVIFTGVGQPPKTMESSEEIIEFVKENTNAIAYIPKEDALQEEVHIVLELP